MLFPGRGREPVSHSLVRMLSRLYCLTSQFFCLTLIFYLGSVFPDCLNSPPPESLSEKRPTSSLPPPRIYNPNIEKWSADDVQAMFREQPDLPCNEALQNATNWSMSSLRRIRTCVRNNKTWRTRGGKPRCIPSDLAHKFFTRCVEKGVTETSMRNELKELHCNLLSNQGICVVLLIKLLTTLS